MLWFHHESHAASFRKIAITFFVLSVVLVGIVFYISFSWTTITVTPKAVSVQEGFVLDVSEARGNPESLYGIVLAKELEVKGTFQPTGEEKGTVQRARGSITIINQSNRSQPLRATTRLQTADGTLFRATQYVVVPAGGRIDAPVIADEAQELGDLSSVRFTLPGLQASRQFQVYGVGFSPSALRPTTKKALSQSDLESAVASLQEDLKGQMTAFVDEQLSGGTAFSNPTYRITVQPTLVARSAEVNDVVESFTTRMTATVTAVVTDAADLDGTVLDQLRRRLPPGYDLIPPDASGVSAEIESVDASAKKATLKVVANAFRVRNAESQDFNKSNLVGLSATAIKSYFSSYDDVEDVDVQLYPFWVTSAPYLVDHIHILVRK